MEAIEFLINNIDTCFQVCSKLELKKEDRITLKEILEKKEIKIALDVNSSYLLIKYDGIYSKSPNKNYHFPIFRDNAYKGINHKTDYILFYEKDKDLYFHIINLKGKDKDNNISQLIAGVDLAKFIFNRIFHSKFEIFEQYNIYYTLSLFNKKIVEKDEFHYKLNIKGTNYNIPKYYNNAFNIPAVKVRTLCKEKQGIML